MIRPTLHELYANNTGKVSDKWSLYLGEYERLFAPMRDSPVRLLELGVQNGGSLDIWSQFFPNAEAIVGCDINPDCERLTYNDPRVGVIVGDASGSANPTTYPAAVRPVRHRGRRWISSIQRHRQDLRAVFSASCRGRIFVIEDLHCSYSDSFEGGLYYPYSSVQFFKCLVDVINHEHWGVPKDRGEILHGIFAKYGCELDEETLALIHSVEFVNSMCVVRKSSAAKSGLGVRVVAGALESVYPLMECSGTPYELDPLHDQTKNVWANRSAAPEEMNELLSREILVLNSEKRPAKSRAR